MTVRILKISFAADGFWGVHFRGAEWAFDYQTVRQDGSHIRHTTTLGGTHLLTVPNHRPLKTGTLLGGVLEPMAAHHKFTVEELLAKLEL